MFHQVCRFSRTLVAKYDEICMTGFSTAILASPGCTVAGQVQVCPVFHLNSYIVWNLSIDSVYSILSVSLKLTWLTWLTTMSVKVVIVCGMQSWVITVWRTIPASHSSFNWETPTGERGVRKGGGKVQGRWRESGGKRKEEER